ncbi:uncharacterized protein LOC115066514 [Bactrocera dorsalis]|uniref:Uncharacterized protein LOC115066514 n=1 Tax=Bactrocera dorsalis TaxID=27457 RepID=A0A8N4L9E0_BACDO|nr:uncharacterized protein LOC115066514 [Bactrocera dorsalis]
MLWNDLCYKLYFWPFLNYLAGIKGICPFYPVTTTTTTTTTAATTTTTTTAATTLPTFPTPPTFPSTSASTITTLMPCPAQPLACLNGGTPPIPYCPCIDPRQSGMMNGMGSTPPMPSLALRGGAALSSDRLVFMPVNAQQNVAQGLQQQPSGSANVFNFPLGPRNGVQPSAAPNPSETLVFSSLSGRRRRKRRK